MILLVIVALLPLFGLALYDLYERRQQSARTAQARLVEIAQRAVADQYALLGTAHQFLLSLAQYQQTTTPSPIACTILFDELLRHNRLYANLGVLDAQGNLICAAVMPEQPLDLSQHPYFARVLQQKVRLGEFEISKIVGTPTINLAIPLVDDKNQVQGAVFASLNPTWLREFAEVQKLPADSTFALIEREHAFALRYPDFDVFELGAPIRALPAQAAQLPAAQHTAEIRDADNITRLYAFVALGNDGYLGVGLPTSWVYAEIDRVAQRDAVALILVALLAMSAAWWYGDRFITQRVRAMLHTAQRIQAGDLGARTEQTYDASELGQLAYALDQMAITLQQRAAEQHSAAEALRQHAEELATITNLSRQVTAVSDLNQVLTVIARTTAELAQTDASGVYLPDENGVLRLAVGYGVSRAFIETLNAMGLRPGEGAIGRAIIERRPIQVPDTQVGYEPRFADLVREEGIRSILAVPMFRNDHLTGGIVLWHRQPRQFAPFEIAFLQAVAQQCVNAIENARLLQAERDARELAEALRDTAAALNSTLDFDEVVNRILINVERVVPYDSANLMLVEGDTARLVRHRFRVPRKDWGLCQSLSVSATPNIRRIIETRQATVIADTRQVSDWVDFPETRWIRSHVSAPLRLKHQVLGLLSLDSATPNFFNATHAQRLQAFADQAVLALENARLLSQAETRAQHLALLAETARDVSIPQNPTVLLETIVERARVLMATAHSALFLYDASRRELEFVMQKGKVIDVPLGTRLQLGEGMAGRVAQTQQPMIVNDYHRWEHQAAAFANTPVSVMLQVPLLYRGELLGVLAVAEWGESSRRFNDEDIRLLTLFASYVAGAIHNARLWQETQTRAEQLALLYDAGLALNSILEPRAQLEHLLTIAQRVLRADRVSFFRYNPLRAKLEPELCIGYDADITARWHQLAQEIPVPGWVAAQHLPLYLPDVSADPRYVEIDPSIRSGMWIPIEREQRLLGVLGVLSTRRNAFSSDAERLLGLFANQAAVALENTRLFGELQSSLHTLTRLYDLSNQMLAAEDVTVLAQRATQILRETFAATSAWMHLFDAQGNHTFGYGVGIESVPQEELAPRPAGLARQVWRSGQPFFANDPQLLHPVARAHDIRAAVVVPLRDQPINLGVLYLSYRTPPTLGGREMELLSLFANQVALAIKRLRLMEETQQRANQLAILNRIANAINQPARLDDLLETVYREITSLLPCDAFYLALYDAITNELDYRIRIDQGIREQPTRKPLGNGLGAWIVREQRPLLIQDYTADTRFPPPTPEMLFGTMQIPRAWLGVPILLGEQVVGVISTQAYTPNVYDEEDQQLLVTIADQIAVAIQRARLFEETQQRLRELEATNQLSSALRTALGTRDILAAVLEATLRALGARDGLAILYDAERASQEVLARGLFTRADYSALLSAGEIVQPILTQGTVYIAREFCTDPLMREVGCHNCIPAGWGGVLVPIRTTHATIGVMLIAVQLPRVLQPTEARLAQTLAEMAGSAIHRANLYEQTERQVQRLNALHTIDMAISATPDLRVSLNILLDQALLQLGADAACVHVLDRQTQTLECVVGQGFRYAPYSAYRLPTGESYALKTILEQRIVQHTDLAAMADPRATLCLAEGFVTYYAAPLVAKGQLQGVLEIFYRTAHRPTTEWWEFLETLAGQAAIAIELANSVSDLQRSNLELGVAYDSTIEAWSRLLDLHDHETEGHTQRVAELSVRLARAVGISENEVMHLRRGALLHDIGKIAVPDHILQKKGELTAEEAEEMQKHPQYAYEVLSSIEYLRNAIDIPYCHHERWDGTGYPRGLKGEEIPLAARIFAIVDVWDALRSPRPYREAWDRARACAYMRAQAGKYFDPHLVETFLRLIENDPDA
ncbi:MAG: GAF domain-containing protein [Anaerolineae bacterium]|nr:GAF domain-containing protein [Anaerolineae bacterium]